MRESDVNLLMDSERINEEENKVSNSKLYCGSHMNSHDLCSPSMSASPETSQVHFNKIKADCDR